MASHRPGRQDADAPKLEIHQGVNQVAQGRRLRRFTGAAVELVK